jgi:predicted ester cyclase
LAARLLLHVRHEGEFLGVAPTGASATLAITTLLTVRDGRCVERWSTADMFGLLQQLQAPASAPGAAA